MDLRTGLETALELARSQIALADECVANISLVRANDVVDVGRGMQCGNRAVQLSSGSFSATVLRIELFGIIFGYNRCNQDVLIQHPGEWHAICVNKDKGSYAAEICTDVHIMPRPSNSESWIFAAHSKYINRIGYRQYNITNKITEKDLKNVTDKIISIVDNGESNASGIFSVKSELIGILLNFFAIKLNHAYVRSALKSEKTTINLMSFSSRFRTLNIDNLSKELKTSRRNLYYSTMRSAGVSPKRLLISMALRNVMSEITDSLEHQCRISDLAYQHGFEHMGRFSRDYKKLFGEGPSATVRRIDHQTKCRD